MIENNIFFFIQIYFFYLVLNNLYNVILFKMFN